MTEDGKAADVHAAEPGVTDAMPANRSAAMADLRDAGLWLRSLRAETWIILALVVALMVAWAVVAAQFSKAIIPSLGDTIGALIGMLRDYRSGYLKAVGSTVQNYYLGLGLAIVVGLVLAGLMGLSHLLAKVMKIVLDFLANIPLIAFMPILVALLGLGDAGKIVMVMLTAMIVITTSAYAAFEAVDKSAEEAAKGLGASKLQAQLHVVWPSILPQLIAGMRLAAAQALTACIIAEIYTAMTGLGGLIVGYGASFNMPRYLVAVLTTVIVGSATAALLRRLERRVAVP